MPLPKFVAPVLVPSIEEALLERQGHLKGMAFVVLLLAFVSL